MMTEREAVVAEALSWLGTKFHHRARVKSVGVDCIHFMLEVYERTGVFPHIDPGPYAHDYMLHQGEEVYRNTMEKYATRRPDGELPEPGDLALFKFGRCLSHGGIITQYPIMVHSFYGMGVIQTNILTDSHINTRLAGFWVPNKWVV